MELPTAAVRPARPGRHRRGAHPEEKAVRSAVRQLCAERIEPHVAGWSERGRIDDVRGLAKELGALGVLGMHLEGYGCAGMSATEYGLACLELEAADSGIRCLVSVQGSLAMFTLWRWGSAEQKAGQHPVREQHPVRLPADGVLPGVTGLKGPLSCLNEARYGIIWGPLGAGRRAVSRRRPGPVRPSDRRVPADPADAAPRPPRGRR